MDEGKLLFLRPHDGTGHLVFGDTGDAGGGAPDAEFGLDAELPGLGELALVYGAVATVDALLEGDIEGDLPLVWDANVSRGGLRCELQAKHQEGQSVAAGLSSHWQATLPMPTGLQARWQQAQPRHGAMQAHWQLAQPMRAAVQHRYQAASQVRGATRQHWQDAERLRGALLHLYQEGEHLRGAARLHWQETLRLRSAVLHHYQQGLLARAAVRSHYEPALPMRVPERQHWQDAMRPTAGMYVPPVVRPREPCYDPATVGRLVFSDPWANGARLVFVCERHGPGPDPEPEQPQYVIPLLRVYMTVHSISALLLPSLERVQLKGVSISSDDDGYAWTLSASGPEHLFDQLAPVGGFPARVKVTLDGIEWVFAIDPPDRSRKFAERSVPVRGRSVTALLTSPYTPSSTWGNPGGAFTAQQLALQALEFTGVDLDWRITDWLVPAGAWSFQGAPLAVVQRIAEAAGAVVRSHRTDEKLIVAPRYPSLPWEWAAATVNVQMPGQIMTTDNLARKDNPEWEAVNVVGETVGVEGHVVRRGTAGAVLAAAVIDPLITHADAASQRGRSVLGPAGLGYSHTMTVPLLTGGTNPGLILPGYLLQVDEPGLSWRGLVRGITVTESNPTVRQQLVVERKA